MTTKFGYVKTNQTVFETGVFTSLSTVATVMAGSFKYSQKNCKIWFSFSFPRWKKVCLHDGRKKENV